MKNSIQSLRQRRHRLGFTLVELLVVIGIIALLISILLPALSAAKAQANNIKCLSNVRQLVLATKMFALDHQGCMPTATTDDGSATSIPRLFDPYRQKFIWRADPSNPAGYLSEWASSLLPYLGYRQSDAANFLNESLRPTPGWINPPVLICPSDRFQDIPANSGYMLSTNVAPSTAYFPISYGINVDVACLIDNNGYGRFDSTNIMNVYGGTTNAAGFGEPLQCKIDRIAYASETLLFADCGVRPQVAGATAPLDASDALDYTTNFDGGPAGNQGYTLLGTCQCSWLVGRIPCSIPRSMTPGLATPHQISERHKGHINVAFADGHAASVQPNDFSKVRISPYKMP